MHWQCSFEITPKHLWLPNSLNQLTISIYTSLQEMPVEMKDRDVKSLLNSMINNKRRRQLEKRSVHKKAKRQQLKLQLKVFKNAGAPNLVTGKLPTLVAEIQQTLLDAIDLYHKGEWMLEQDT